MQSDVDRNVFMLRMTIGIDRLQNLNCHIFWACVWHSQSDVGDIRLQTLAFEAVIQLMYCAKYRLYCM